MLLLLLDSHFLFVLNLFDCILKKVDFFFSLVFYIWMKLRTISWTEMWWSFVFFFAYISTVFLIFHIIIQTYIIHEIWLQSLIIRILPTLSKLISTRIALFILIILMMIIVFLNILHMLMINIIMVFMWCHLSIVKILVAVSGIVYVVHLIIVSIHITILPLPLVLGVIVLISVIVVSLMINNISCWNCTFTIYPFAENNMFLSEFHYFSCTFMICVSDESKSSRLASLFIFQNNAIFHLTKLLKVSSKHSKIKI